MNLPAKITLVAETGSTNADLSNALRTDRVPGEEEWLVTRRQTAGKGRQGREWFDSAGNFMGSTVVAIRTDDPPPASLSFVAALAVADAVDNSMGGAVSPTLKWPNDVLLDGGKVSGILLEMVDTHVVIGIGVNLKRAPHLPDRKTAAISDFAPTPALELFAENLAVRFSDRLTDWRERGLVAILQDFARASIHSLGSPVAVHDSDGSRVEGSFAGLEESDGALRLRLADGSERVIRAGDVV